MPNQHTDITILRTLEQNPALTQRGVAAEIGVSLGKVNYCIKKLIEKGSNSRPIIFAIATIKNPTPTFSLQRE